MPKLLRVVPHTVMLVVSIALYWMAARIEADTGGRIGPAVWPKAVIVFMALLCAYEIVKRLLVRSDFEAKGLLSGTEIPGSEPDVVGDRGSDEDPALESGSDPKMLFGGIAIIGGYVVAVPWIGGLRRPVLAVAISLAGTITLALVFLKVAYISLPMGEGPFRALSLGLMRLLGVS